MAHRAVSTQTVSMVLCVSVAPFVLTVASHGSLLYTTSSVVPSIA